MVMRRCRGLLIVVIRRGGLMGVVMLRGMRGEGLDSAVVHRSKEREAAEDATPPADAAGV